MRVLIYISFLLASGLLFGQGGVDYLYEEMPNDSLPEYSIKTHSSLKPTIRLNNSEGRESYIKFSGLGDLHYIQNDYTSIKTGLGVEVKGAIKDKFYFRLAAVEGIHSIRGFYQPKTYISDSIGDGVLYTDLRGRISYTPNHAFNFQVGLDHNFLGEGSRSLLLSDYGGSYPFAQMRIRFWRIEYSIMYQFLREWDNNQWEGKFASSHHVSVNVAKWFNIGIFESVVFQPKDTALNRWFDVEYLNPFVMFRPQEYSLGSSDNVLLGIDLSANYYREHMFYAQFILDEFYLAELMAKSKWWASKYGGQFGFKGRFKKNEHSFFYRAEYNFVRPYTYAHISSDLNYGNQGSPLAHPYGSNFMELLVEFKWQHKKLFAKLFANYYVRGANKDGFNYGSDPYLPYVNRPYEYGHYIGQGQQYNGLNSMLTVGYQVLEHGKLNAFIENHVRYSTLDNATRYTLVVGVRSALWNDYRNY
ncbi:MAG: hypothetical protein QNK23_00845 [Crocinitomicaceae bacterium]|nr:hypothetical protein [Crocinitomicaceae bacterium]